LHHAMRLTYLLKLKHARWLRPEAAGSHLLRDRLQRHVRQRETGSPEHETAKEGQIDPACHLQQRIKVNDRIETNQPASQTSPTAPAQHVERIEDGAIAHQVEYRVELLGLGDPLGKIRPLQLDVIRTEVLQHGEALALTGGGDDPHAGVYRKVDCS